MARPPIVMQPSAFVLAALLCASSLRTARAEDPTPAERAAQLKQQGDAAMDSLRYDDAIAAYSEGYGVSRDPVFLYNRGRVYQARSEFPQALADLERFARDAPADLRAKVPLLDDLLADVRAHVATITVACNVPGARILVRNVQVGTTPLVAPLQVNAGAARVEVLAEGYLPFHGEPNLAGGATTAIEATLAKRPAAERAPRVVRASALPTIGLVTAAAGVAGAATGAFFGLRARSQRDDSDSAGCSGNDCNRAGYELRTQAQTSGTLSTIFFTAGGALLAAGVTLWIVAPKAPDAPRVGLAAMPEPVVQGAW